MIDWTKISGFDWDDGNRTKSKDKHNVESFECEEIFSNEPLIVHHDAKHSQDEARYHALGKTDQNRKLLVTFTVRDDKIRIISARPMSRRERDSYA